MIKKYRYLLGKKVREIIKTVHKRIRSAQIKDHSTLALEPLKLSELPYPVRWQEIFSHKSLNIEIGSGHGELLKFLAEKEIDSLSVGFEITKEFSLKSHKKIAHCQNAYIFKGDGYTAALNNFASDSIDKIFILFPDPWHKKRHHKRRPITQEWFRKIHHNLKSGSMIFFATDWEEYFDFVLAHAKSVKDLYSVDSGSYEPTKEGLTETHYYKKWKKQGRKFQFIRLTSV